MDDVTGKWFYFIAEPDEGIILFRTLRDFLTFLQQNDSTESGAVVLTKAEADLIFKPHNACGAVGPVDRYLEMFGKHPNPQMTSEEAKALYDKWIADGKPGSLNETNEINDSIEAQYF